MMIKRVTVEVKDYKPYGMCENCKHRDDKEEICQLRLCFRAFNEVRDCFEREVKENE